MVNDPDFQDLSAHARLLVYTLKAALGRPGIGVVYPGALEAQSGLTQGQLEAAARELEDAGHWWLVRERNVWWLRNGLRFEEVNAKNDNHQKSLVKRVEELPRLPVVRQFREYYRDTFPMLSEGQPDAIPIPSAYHRDTIPRAEKENEKEIKALTPPPRGPVNGRCGISPCICGSCVQKSGGEDVLLTLWNDVHNGTPPPERKASHPEGFRRAVLNKIRPHPQALMQMNQVKAAMVCFRDRKRAWRNTPANAGVSEFVRFFEDHQDSVKADIRAEREMQKSEREFQKSRGMG